MSSIASFSWIKHLHQMKLDRIMFMRKPWSAGGLLLACVVVAMLLANLPFTKTLYKDFLETSMTMHIQSPDHQIDLYFPNGLTVERFINDILMVVFFFTVGLEIKREIVCGELSSAKKAMMPVVAAMGGMIGPAIIYAFINHGTHAASGWGIPTATDIAFAVGIMSMLGSRVPTSLKIFLTALAIADDLGAILIVALFYGGAINWLYLTIAMAVIAMVLLFNRMGEKRMAFYMIPAIVIWCLFYYSGIHSTMSGVVMAFLIPMDPRFKKEYVIRKETKLDEELRKLNYLPLERPNRQQRYLLREKNRIIRNSIGMSYRLENRLNPWVNFIIMPIFALANAGVEIPSLEYFNIFQYSPELGSVGMGIFFGLLLGKPIGITLASFFAVKFKIGKMPSNANWFMFFAVACLGGIGFTMSIFVDTLSFGDLSHEKTEALRSIGKISVLMASLCAGIFGAGLITLFSKKERKAGSVNA